MVKLGLYLQSIAGVRQTLGNADRFPYSRNPQGIKMLMDTVTI